MKTKSWFKKASLAASVLTALASNVALAKEGGASTGGGNATTGRFLNVESDFGCAGDGKVMRNTLKAFLTEIPNYASQGKVSALLQDLLSKGLIEDIEQSEYVFSKKCEEDSEEKDASTLRGVRNAPICINIPKLSRENATKDEVAGLMMHEHVRHFGIEDTTLIGSHPVAIFVTDRVAFLGAKAWLSNLQDMEKEGFPQWGYAYSKPVLKDVSVLAPLQIFSTQPESVTLVIEKVQGDCPNRPLEAFHQGKVVDSFALEAGTRIPLNKHYLLKVDRGMFGISETCKVRFSVENSYGKAELRESYKVDYIEVKVTQLDLSDRRISKIDKDLE